MIDFTMSFRFCREAPEVVDVPFCSELGILGIKSLNATNNIIKEKTLNSSEAKTQHCLVPFSTLNSSDVFRGLNDIGFHAFMQQASLSGQPILHSTAQSALLLRESRDLVRSTMTANSPVLLISLIAANSEYYIHGTASYTGFLAKYFLG